MPRHAGMFDAYVCIGSPAQNRPVVSYLVDRCSPGAYEQAPGLEQAGHVARVTPDRTLSDTSIDSYLDDDRSTHPPALFDGCRSDGARQLAGESDSLPNRVDFGRVHTDNVMIGYLQSGDALLHVEIDVSDQPICQIHGVHTPPEQRS